VEKSVCSYYQKHVQRATSTSYLEIVASRSVLTSLVRKLGKQPHWPALPLSSIRIGIALARVGAESTIAGPCQSSNPSTLVLLDTVKAIGYNVDASAHVGQDPKCFIILREVCMVVDAGAWRRILPTAINSTLSFMIYLDDLSNTYAYVPL
jgi:hypothetical protein